MQTHASHLRESCTQHCVRLNEGLAELEGGNNLVLSVVFLMDCMILQEHCPLRRWGTIATPSTVVEASEFLLPVISS